jgi:hypothetical protein
MYQNIRFLDPAPGLQRQKSILPCTPLAIVKILEYLQIYNTILPYGNRLFGHTICVVNRSEVVGRPLAALLANDGGCVYSVDITGVQQFTRGEGIRKRRHEVVEMGGWTLKDVLPHCDVVITGVPGDVFKLDTQLLRQGAVCINFSTEKVCGNTLQSTSDQLFLLSLTRLPFQAEFWSRSEREGVHLRSSDWKSYNRSSSQKFTGESKACGFLISAVLNRNQWIFIILMD